jgi:hypothetical protein
MSKLSLCILDDKIPVEQLTGININDTSCIDGNILRYCLTLKNDDNSIFDWGDINLRNFVDTIKDDTDYIISGFKNHTFFFNYKEEVLFSPDIIIFDWDMGDNGQDSSTNLLKLLSSTYCLVAIFTSEDTENGVSQEIDQLKFKEYKHRCLLIKKQDKDSVNTLKTKIKERAKDFSFEFGNDFRRCSISALNSVLVDIGKITSDELKHYFNIEEDINDVREFFVEKHHEKLNIHNFNSERIKNSEWVVALLDIIKKKFKRILCSNNIPLMKNNKDNRQLDNSVLEKLWSYRLYHTYSTEDKQVRKGDIIVHEKDEKFYIVINADCNLSRFWNKNWGFINIIPLYLVKNTNDKLINILNLIKDEKSSHYKPNSLSDKLGSFPEGSFCLPFVPYDEGHKTFILFSPTITSFEIKTRNEENFKNKKLTYDQLIGFSRVCSLSEPFVTPLVENILTSLAGHGSPDYNKETKRLIEDSIKEIFPSV